MLKRNDFGFFKTIGFIVSIVLWFFIRPILIMLGTISGKIKLVQWKRLNSKSVRFSKKDDFINAIKCTEESMRLISRSHSEMHPYYLKSLMNLGELHRLNSDYNNSEKCLQKAFYISKKDTPDYFLLNYYLGNLNLDLRNNKKAEMYYLENLKYYELNKTDPIYDALLFYLTKLSMQMGQYKRTGQYSLEKGKPLQSSNMHDLDYAEELTVKANYFLKQYKFHEAEIEIQKALSIFQAQPSSENVQYADCLLIYTEILLGLNEPIKVKISSQKAFSIFRNHFGDQNITTINAMTYVARCNFRLNQFNEAERMITTAIEFYLRTFGEFSLNYVGVLESRMLLYSKQEQFTYADDLFIRLINIMDGFYCNELSELNESERMGVLDSLWARELVIYNYLIENCSRNPQLISEALRFRLYSKSLLLKGFTKGNIDPRKSKAQIFQD